MMLHILIPTTKLREHFLDDMLANIGAQIIECNAQKKVDVLVSYDERLTTGEKRNSLLFAATAKYVWFVDDDDYIYPDAIKNILSACEKDPDVIGINGLMTTDGINPVYWEIRLGHPYKAIVRDGKEFYLRWPNHITPMKREHAIKAKFPHITEGEDYLWSKEINDAGYLKTQEVIEDLVYHYKFINKKKHV